MVPPPSFAQLEKAALAIVSLISDTPGLGSTRLAVTGDLAVCKYLSRFDQITVSPIHSHVSSPRFLQVTWLTSPDAEHRSRHQQMLLSWQG